MSDFNAESFVIAGNTSNHENEDAEFLECNGIRARVLSQSFNPLFDLLSFFQIRRVVKAIKPEVVNTHTFKAGVIGRLAVLSLGKRRPALVHTVHGHLLYGYFPGYMVRLIVIAEKFLSHFTELVLFSGKTVLTECEKAGMIGHSRSRIVNPGVNIPHTRINRSEKPKVIGWLGRFVEVKNPKLAIDVATLLPELDFIFGGDGPLFEEMRKQAPANCRFLGWVNEQSFWSQCDIALLTSKNEAQPYSILEAMANGLPVVATDVGSVSDVVVHNLNGNVCSSDPTELSYAIRELIDSHSLYEKYSWQGSKRARDLFSLSNQAKQHYDLYQEAIQIRHASE
jgi:glycosyltransferase involved in cell wall biosynthesis